MCKRVLALFLTAAFIAGCFPAISFAAVSSGAAQTYNGKLSTISTFEDSQKHFNIATATSIASMTSVGGKSANIVINFTDETIYWNAPPANGEEPTYISFNNGETWSRMKFAIGSSSEKPESMSRYLSRDSEILLTTELNKDRQPYKSDQPGKEDAIVYRFEKIYARPKIEKFIIDYETYAVLGEDGQWTLKFDGNQNVANLIVAYSADRNKPIGDRYGIFPAGEGINVVASENRAGEKLTFFICVAATDNSAASRAKKINISTLIKTPNVKIDYRRSIIRLRPNMMIGTVTGFVKDEQTGMDTNVIDKAVYTMKPTTKQSDEVVKGVSFIVGEEAINYAVRTAATTKNPASEQLLLHIPSMSQISEHMASFTVKRNRIKLPIGYEACLWADRDKPSARWSRSVSTDRSAVYAVRVRNNARYNARRNITMGRTVSGNLILDVYALRDTRGRPTLVASYIDENGGVKTASSVDRAVYIRAKDLNSTIRAVENRIPESRFYEVKIKGGAMYFTNGMESTIKDAKEIEKHILGEGIIGFSFVQMGDEVLRDGEIIVTFGIDNPGQTFYSPVLTLSIIGHKDG